MEEESQPVPALGRGRQTVTISRRKLRYEGLKGDGWAMVALVQEYQAKLVDKMEAQGFVQTLDHGHGNRLDVESVCADHPWGQVREGPDPLHPLLL